MRPGLANTTPFCRYRVSLWRVHAQETLAEAAMTWRHACVDGKCIHCERRRAYSMGIIEPWRDRMKLGERLRRYVELRRAVRELEGLDDRALHDIGVARSHIRGAVEGR